MGTNSCRQNLVQGWWQLLVQFSSDTINPNGQFSLSSPPRPYIHWQQAADRSMSETTISTKQMDSHWHAEPPLWPVGLGNPTSFSFPWFSNGMSSKQISMWWSGVDWLLAIQCSWRGREESHSTVTVSGECIFPRPAWYRFSRNVSLPHISA